MNSTFAVLPDCHELYKSNVRIPCRCTQAILDNMLWFQQPNREICRVSHEWLQIARFLADKHGTINRTFPLGVTMR